MKGFNFYTIVLLFIILFIPLYQIYKYGLSGYYNRKIERRQRRNQQIINFLN